MTRLIDADAVEKVLTDLYIKRPLDSDRWVIEDIKESIIDLPTVDAVPVIRCKDCKSWRKSYFESVDGMVCNKTSYIMKPDDYCSMAKPKETE